MGAPDAGSAPQGLERPNLRDPLEVVVVVQEERVVVKGDLRDEAVRRAPYRQAAPARVEPDPRRRDVRVPGIAGFDELLGLEELPESAPLDLIACSLKDFENTRKRDAPVRFVSDHLTKPIRRRRPARTKDVDQDRGVGKNHLPIRSFL